MKRIIFIAVSVFFSILGYSQSDTDVYLQDRASMIYVPTHPQKEIVPTAGCDTIPPYDFYAKLGYNVGNTFNNTYALTADTTLFLALSSIQECVIYIFDKNNPENFSISFTNDSISGSLHLCEKYIRIPRDGEYLLLVCASSQGKCSLHVNNKSYNNVDVANNFIEIPLDTLHTYSSFTALSSQNFNLCAIDASSPGRVLAFNDHYQGTGDFSWGSEARIKKRFNTPVSGFIVFANYDYSHFAEFVLRITDIYLGCKTPTNILPYFPNLEEDDAIQTAPDSETYNCISWAGGEWDKWSWPPFELSPYYDTDALTAFDNYFLDHGLTRVGATEANSVVDLWMNDGYFTHASVKSFSNEHACGYAWESKAGSLPRFMHPRYALEGFSWSGYGSVQYHYIPITGFEEEQCIVENQQFTNAEMLYISQRVNMIPAVKRMNFAAKYHALKNEFSSSALSNFELLESSSNYTDLLSMCLSDQNILCLLYQRLSSGDLQASLILRGATMASNMDIMQYIWAYNNNNYTEDGTKIRRTILGNAILYAKYLIARAQGLNFAQLSSEGRTYSDDERILSASNFENSIKIALTLEEEADIVVNISSDNGRSVRTLMETHAGNGKTEIKTGALEKGLYIINAHVNGRIYSKKIIIK